MKKGLTKTSAILYLPVLLFCLLFAACSNLRDTRDSIPDYKPVLKNPAYPAGTGPRIYIDEAHNNYHTLSGKYAPFANLFRNDGYRLYPNKVPFKPNTLDDINILVIVNAIHSSGLDNWQIPVASAFSMAEIRAVNDWVSAGGALLLIVDHFPLSGASKQLAASFGFSLNNGHAHGSDNKRHIRFSRQQHMIREHVITTGNSLSEKVNSVYTWSGDAFQIPPQANPLLVFSKGSYALNPNKAFTFTKDTERIDISGWSMGAARKYGSGKVVVLGESGAFTVQNIGKKHTRVGLDSAQGPENRQFILNVMHWLSGRLQSKQ